MLQQTQVDRVVPHYERFLGAFPTPSRTCAGAGATEVVRRWSGLGYNRRAVNLQRAATDTVEPPRVACVSRRDDAALRRLPGVGPYTARAVRSFAYGQDVAAVDTNGVRVLARAVAGAGLTGHGRARALGDRLVPPAVARGTSTGRCSTSVRPCARRGAPTARAAPSGVSAPGVASAGTTRGAPARRREARARSPVPTARDGAASSKPCGTAR